MRRLVAVALLALAPLAGAAERKPIRPAEFPAAWPFSPGLLVGDTLYVSGMTGVDLRTSEYPADFEAEVKQCLDNVRLVLRAAGMDLADVVSVQVFLTDLALFKPMNVVYRTVFAREPLPTRTTSGASALAGKARIEITVVARR